MVKSGSDMMQNEGKVLILNSITSSNIENFTLKWSMTKIPKDNFSVSNRIVNRFKRST